MKIRKATKKDIPQLVKLYANLPQLRDFAGQQFRRNYFESFIGKKDRFILVGEEERGVIAALNAEFEAAEYVFLFNIVVKREFRKEGRGTALLTHVEKLARKKGNKHLILVVYDWNKPMHTLMGELGFDVYGKTVVYSKRL